MAAGVILRAVALAVGLTRQRVSLIERAGSAVASADEIAAIEAAILRLSAQRQQEVTSETS